MPKISRRSAEQNRAAIERAAVGCFVRRGYHGVTVRELAAAANVSLGNLYTYYPDKLSLFTAALGNLSADFVRVDNPFGRYLLTSQFPDDLPAMGEAIAANLDRYRDYMKLIYVDVVEFDGTHIREIFSHLDDKFRAVLRTRFERLGGLGPRGNIDPAFAFVAVYISLYQYFMLTKLFGAKATYGARSDREVVGDLVTLFTDGLRQPKRRTRMRDR